MVRVDGTLSMRARAGELVKVTRIVRSAFPISNRAPLARLAGPGEPDCFAHMGAVTGIEPTGDGCFILSSGGDGAHSAV